MGSVSNGRRVQMLGKKRMLVTGGAGFIGSHLLRTLCEAGVACVATYHSELEDALCGNIQWISIDLKDAKKVSDAVTEIRPHIIVHLAAKLGSERSVGFAEEAFASNCIATHNVLIAAGRERGVLEKIILLGTSEEYGRSEILPITEDQQARPVSPYSASKAAATQFALLYHALFGLPAVILRPFIVYGPGQPPTMMIPELIHTLLEGKDFPMTEGEQTRDFVFVQDVVECILAAAAAGDVHGEIFNVCSGREHSIREVAEIIHRSIPSPSALRVGALPYRQNEVWRLYGSNEKAKRILGWEPTTTLEQGLQQTIEWYKGHMAGARA